MICETMAGDNRFEIIAKAKHAILDSTNIETDEDEMKVLDNILFRCWQMGWLDKYGNQQADGDLISRQDALAEFRDGRDVYNIMESIEELPSAPDSRQRGEWVRKYDGYINCYWYECDQCGEYRPRNQFGHEYNANFCPNCGAKMGGDET